jgi:hypothetical protein
VFNGHCHVYERTWPIRAGKVDLRRGVIYITSGGGGGPLESFSPVPTWFKAQNRSDYHFWVLRDAWGKRSVLRIMYDRRDKACRQIARSGG